MHNYLLADAIIEDFQDARQKGKSTLKELSESFDQKVETIFKEGAGHEIIYVTGEENVDLIILGTHGYKGWKRFALGSVAIVGLSVP